MFFWEMLKDGLTVSQDRVNVFSILFRRTELQFSFKMFSLRNEGDGCTDVGEEILTKLHAYGSLKLAESQKSGI